jgi:prolipoprotein diacylglyceryltransferase
MGMLLSIPVILAGIAVLVIARRRKPLANVQAQTA